MKEYQMIKGSHILTVILFTLFYAYHGFFIYWLLTAQHLYDGWVFVWLLLVYFMPVLLIELISILFSFWKKSRKVALQFLILNTVFLIIAVIRVLIIA